MRKLATAIILAVVLAGGWFIVEQVGRVRLRDAIAQTRAQLGPDGSFTYASAKPAPFRLGADFTAVQVRRHGMVMNTGRLSFSRVFGRRIGHAVLQDVQVEANGVSLHADRIVADRIVADRLRAEPAHGSPEFGDLDLGSLQADLIETHAQATPGVGVRLAHLSMHQDAHVDGGFSQDSTATGIVVLGGGGPVATAARGTVHVERAAALGPVESRSSLGDLVVPVQSSLGRALGQFGILGAHGSMQSSARYDPQAQRVAAGPTVLQLDGIGRLEVTLGMDRLPAASPSGDAAVPSAQQMLQRVAQARLTGLALTYDDAGLAGDVIATFAQRAGATPAQFRAAISANIEQHMQGEPDGPQLQFQQQAVRFLSDPRRFVITLQPPSPLPLPALALLNQLAPADAARSVGLHVKAD